MRLLALSTLLCLGCLVFLASPASADHHMGGEHAGPSKAVCTLFPTVGSEVVGVVIFEETDGKVTITGKVFNLTPGKHGFHIHEFGDLSDLKSGKSTGGHFSPGGHDHGKPSDDAANRHVGDLGNIEADENGTAIINITDSVIDLHGENSILGRGIVVHAEEDKFTQPTGDAGGRVAIGTIGIAKDSQPKMDMKAKGENAEKKESAMDKMKNEAAKMEKKAEEAEQATEKKAAEMKKDTEAAASNAEKEMKKEAAEAEKAVKETAKDAEKATKDAADSAEKTLKDAADATEKAAEDAAASVEETVEKAVEDAKD